MPEVNEETRGVLEALRHADEPHPHDAVRVQRAVWARLGLVGAVAASGLSVVAGGTAVTSGTQATGVAASANALGAASSLAGTAGATHATAAAGLAVGVAAGKTAVLLSVSKVGLALTLLGVGAWYGARTVTPSASSVATPVAQIESASGRSLVEAKSPATVPHAEKESAVQQALATAQSPVSSDAASATKPSNGQGAARSGAASDVLSAEVSLLAAAQQALSQGLYAQALHKLDEHARRFPKGTLASERNASRAIALCRSGNTQRGRPLAQRYLARHAGSPLSTRVRTACEVE